MFARQGLGAAGPAEGESEGRYRSPESDGGEGFGLIGATRDREGAKNLYRAGSERGVAPVARGHGGQHGVAMKG